MPNAPMHFELFFMFAEEEKNSDGLKTGPFFCKSDPLVRRWCEVIIGSDRDGFKRRKIKTRYCTLRRDEIYNNEEAAYLNC